MSADNQFTLPHKGTMISETSISARISAKAAKRNSKKNISIKKRNQFEKKHKFSTYYPRIVLFVISFIPFINKTYADSSFLFMDRQQGIFEFISILAVLCTAMSFILDVMDCRIKYSESGPREEIGGAPHSALPHLTNSVSAFVFAGAFLFLNSFVDISASAIWIVSTGLMISMFQLLSPTMLEADGNLWANTSSHLGDAVKFTFFFFTTSLLSDSARGCEIVVLLFGAAQLLQCNFAAVNADYFVKQEQGAVLDDKVQHTSLYITAVAVLAVCIPLLASKFIHVLWTLLPSDWLTLIRNKQVIIQLVVMGCFLADFLVLVTFNSEGLLENNFNFIVVKAVEWLVLSVINVYSKAIVMEYRYSNVQEEIRSKRIFVKYISHEIRGPVTNTQLGIKILLQSLDSEGVKPMSKAEIVDILKDLMTSCEVAASTLNDILLFDKIRSKMFSIVTSPEKGLKFVTQCMKPFRLQASSSEIKFQVATKGSSVKKAYVNMDKAKLTQVLRNMLTNSLKFTPFGGTITVQVSMNDKFSGPDDGAIYTTPGKSDFDAEKFGVFRVAVIDSGAGISAENLPRLFGQYVQFNANTLQGGKGSGLGLWISKMIVEQHGGIVGAVSGGEGQGTTIFFEVPCLREPVVAAVRNRSLRGQNLWGDGDNENNSDSISENTKDFELDRGESVQSNWLTTAARETIGNLDVVTDPGNNDVLPFPSPRSEDSESRQSKSSHHTHQSRADISSSVPTIGPTFAFGSRRVLPVTDVSASKSNGLTRHPSMFWQIGPDDEQSEVSGRKEVDWKKFRIKFLVVDDTTVSRKLVSRLLLPISRVTDQAENGAVALSMVQESIVNGQRYDVVLIDYNMPFMNGPKAVEQMRKCSFDGIIIGLTAAGDDERCHFIESGANAALSKPLNLEDLVAVLLEFV